MTDDADDEEDNVDEVFDADVEFNLEDDFEVKVQTEDDDSTSGDTIFGAFNMTTGVSKFLYWTFSQFAINESQDFFEILNPECNKIMSKSSDRISPIWRSSKYENTNWTKLGARTFLRSVEGDSIVFRLQVFSFKVLAM